MKVTRFKFKPIDASGQPSGILSGKGKLDELALTLGDESIALENIVRALRRPGVLVLEIEDDHDVEYRPLVITKGNGPKLLKLLNVLCSARRAEVRRQKMQAAYGGASRFRAERCPHCQATVDLTDFERTAQMYCPHCDTVCAVSGNPPADESKYRLCPTCGLYARVKRFLALYFLYIFYVTSEHHKCTRCMRKPAWAMLAINFLTILFFPFALWQLLRVYLVGPRFSTAFAGLDRANGFALAGKTDRAVREYELIEQRLGQCAGIRFNHAVALGRGGRPAEAESQLGQALADCANYVIAHKALERLRQRHGDSTDSISGEPWWEDIGSGEPEWTKELQII